jgi:hypothetical protein
MSKLLTITHHLQTTISVRDLFYSAAQGLTTNLNQNKKPLTLRLYVNPIKVYIGMVY